VFAQLFCQPEPKSALFANSWSKQFHVLAVKSFTLLKTHHPQSNPASNATQLNDALTSVSELLHVDELDLSKIPCVVEMSIVFAKSLLMQLLQLTMRISHQAHIFTGTALSKEAAVAVAVTTG
jgi:hypothetical protein